MENSTLNDQSKQILDYLLQRYNAVSGDILPGEMAKGFDLCKNMFRNVIQHILDGSNCWMDLDTIITETTIDELSYLHKEVEAKKLREVHPLKPIVKELNVQPRN